MLELVFWLCVLVAIHTYFLFPIIIGFIARLFRSKNSPRVYDDIPMPSITVVIAAYNEEKNIRRRIENIDQQDYPKNLLHVLIGSDGSTDETNDILRELKLRFTWLDVKVFTVNRGKSSVINDLVKLVKDNIIVFTDADIVFDASALRELVAPFSQPHIGAVCGTRLVDPTFSDSTLISEERSYLRFDNRIREAEGACGCVIGAHGSLFAMRREIFVPLPDNAHYTDDFYYSMLPLEQGYEVVAAPKAVSYSTTAEDASVDFRRRVRYSTTGFATLLRFSGLLFSRRVIVSYAFWSHRVLRWLFPVLMLLVLGLNVLLMDVHRVYLLSLVLQTLFYLSALLGWLLSSASIPAGPLRFSYYFVMSNAALLLGLVRFLLGKNSKTWKPSR